jgi:hypothetical protein
MSQQELDELFWLIAPHIKDPHKTPDTDVVAAAKIVNDPESSPFQLQFNEFFDEQTLDSNMTLFAD